MAIISTSFDCITRYFRLGVVDGHSHPALEGYNAIFMQSFSSLRSGTLVF